MRVDTPSEIFDGFILDCAEDEDEEDDEEEEDDDDEEDDDEDEEDNEDTDVDRVEPLFKRCFLFVLSCMFILLKEEEPLFCFLVETFF